MASSRVFSNSDVAILFLFASPFHVRQGLRSTLSLFLGGFFFPVMPSFPGVAFFFLGLGRGVFIHRPNMVFLVREVRSVRGFARPVFPALYSACLCILIPRVPPKFPALYIDVYLGHSGGNMGRVLLGSCVLFPQAPLLPFPPYVFIGVLEFYC